MNDHFFLSIISIPSPLFVVYFDLKGNEDTRIVDLLFYFTQK